MPSARRALPGAPAPAGLLLAALAALAPACGERVNQVQLGIASTGLGPPALLCRDDVDRDGGPLAPDASGPYLINRARAAGQLNVVVDFFGIEGGVPGCLPAQYISFCETHCCRVLPSARACVPVTLPMPPPSSAIDIAMYVRAALTGRQVTSNAPDGLVTIRATATTQSCAEVSARSGVAPPLDTNRVVGCAYSCPVVLDAITGEVLLDLPVLGDQCAPVVRRCASIFEEQSAAVCR